LQELSAILLNFDQETYRLKAKGKSLSEKGNSPVQKLSLEASTEASVLAENILKNLINLKDITAKEPAVLGSVQRDKSVEYQAASVYLREQITKLQAITTQPELQTFISKNEEIARELFERSDRTPDKTKVNNYCDFFYSNPNIDHSDEHQERIIALCDMFNLNLAEKKKLLGVAGGKRKRRNSQKKKKKKSNRKKKKKSKASRKKKRN